jgi:glycosyltransferase involved in cell wall biosynthesis
MILDFLLAWCAAEGADLFALLQRSYGERILAHRAAIEAGQFAPVLAHGIYGTAALLDLVPAAAVIVNSTVAQDLLRRDAPRFPGERIWQLYHPVFAAGGAQLARPDELTIGSFGLPSPSKLTERVVEAFREVRARRPGARLIIAGYQAGAYAAEHGLQGEANVSWLDSPSDEEFTRLMRTCHVAVQLRSANFGESSGVVPQLLAVGTPTIVSKLGAFTGFGDAVAYFDPGGSATALADLIMAEAGRGAERKAAMRRYVEAHPAERFCSDLRRLILADLDGTGEGRAA